MSTTQPIAHRHDILILFEVTNGNPNGDPDSGNQPRVDALSQRGLVSDVCLKRKVRNYVELFPPASNGKHHKILIRQGAVLNREQEKAVEATKDPEAAEKEKGKAKGKSDGDHARRVKDWLCREFFDVRSFGAVISTGSEVMKGSAYGQIRGPVQFSFGQSFDPISPQEITITRCAVTKEEDVAKERTMGQKYIVPYGLYAARCYVSPAFAENTGFDQARLRPACRGPLPPVRSRPLRGSWRHGRPWPVRFRARRHPGPEQRRAEPTRSEARMRSCPRAV